MPLQTDDRPPTPVRASTSSIAIGAVWSELAFVAFGAGSALAVAALLAWINVTFHIALFAWSFWVVIPVGAFLCGTAAGSGYLLGAQVMRRSPGTLARLGAVVTGALGYFAIYYFEYRGISVDGVALSSNIPFASFVDAVIRQSTVGLGFRGPVRTASLGAAGYPLAALHLAGFIFGGFGASVMAGAGLACDRCRRFLSHASAAAYGRSAVDAFPYVHQLVQQGHGAAALSHIETLTEPESNVRLKADISTCIPCAREHFSVALAALSSVAVGYIPIGEATPATEQWKPLSGNTAAGYVDTATTPAPAPQLAS